MHVRDVAKVTTIIKSKTVIAKDVKKLYLLVLYQICDIHSMSRENALTQKLSINAHSQLGLPDKGCAIKGFVVCNDWDLETFDLLNGLALDCYQPSLRYESFTILVF